MMDTSSVARRLIELCRKGEFDRAQEELYAQDAVSLEPEGKPEGGFGDAHGLDAIRQKGKAFDQNVEEIHSVTVSEPLIAGEFFSVVMGMDATYKQGGRMAMEELCVYRVREGKIVLEQFFYSMG